MSKQAAAVLSTQALYVTCPLCGEGIESPTGSLCWMNYEVKRVMGKKVMNTDLSTSDRLALIGFSHRASERMYAREIVDNETGDVVALYTAQEANAFADGRESGLRFDDKQCPFGYLQEAEAKAWWDGVEDGLRVRRNLNKLCTS